MSAQERLWSDTLHPVQSPKPLAALSINLDQNVKPVSVPSAMRNLYLPFLGLSSPDDLKIYMLHGVDALTCSICQNFSHKSKYTLQNHIESKHFPNTFVYTCPKCQKNVSTREALICHKKRCSSYWCWLFCLRWHHKARGLQCLCDKRRDNWQTVMFRLSKVLQSLHEQCAQPYWE